MAKLATLSRSSLAYLSAPFLGVQGAGRRFGTVPYLSVPVELFTIDTFDPPRPFLEPNPYGLPRAARWDGDPPYKCTQNSTAVVPSGSADHRGFVFDAAGRPIHGACQPRRQMLKYRWRVRRDGIEADYMREKTVPSRFAGRMAVLTATNQHFYYHWLFDVLPRLHLAMQGAGEVDWFYIQHHTPFQKQTLAHLGVHRSPKLLKARKYIWVGADELVVPCHQIMTGHHYPQWVLDWLRQAFLPLAGEVAPGTRRIYVSRSLARNRRLVNEDDLWPILEQRGFERVHTENLSFADQVRLFAGAEAVVAPHGAGLANLVFSPPGTRVVELFPNRTMDGYYRLCHDLGFEYGFVKTRQFRLHRRVGGDFTIDRDDLTGVLERLRLA